MNFYSALLLCALFALGFSQDPTRPVISETFMSNITIYSHSPNLTKFQGWITQDHDKEAFAMTVVLPKGHHQFPNGGLFMEIQINGKKYNVGPGRNGDPECECFDNYFLDHWWWLIDSILSKDPPPPATGLQCWGVGEHVNKEVCVKESMPTIPVQEYMVMMRPDFRYYQFDHYVADKFNTTMLEIPKVCMNKIC